VGGDGLIRGVLIKFSDLRGRGGWLIGGGGGGYLVAGAY